MRIEDARRPQRGRSRAQIRNGTPCGLVDLTDTRGGHCKSLRPQVHMKCSIWDRAKITYTGFRFWNVQSSTKLPPHQPTIWVSVGGIYLYDITNTRKQLCSPNEPFVVVLEKGFYFFHEISSFGVDFEICNFVDRFITKHTQYTLIKIHKKWKSKIGFVPD